MSDYLLNVGKSNHLAVGSLRNTSGKFSPKVVADFNLVKWLGSTSQKKFLENEKSIFFSLENLPGKSRYTYMLSLADHPKAWFSLSCNILPFLVFISRKFVSSTSALPHVPKILPAWQNFCGLDFCAESEATFLIWSS